MSDTMTPAMFPASVFGIQSNTEFEGFAEDTALCRPIDPDYVFDRQQLTNIQLWRDSTEPLYISGPTGCGKTTFVHQYCARLNIPLVELTGRPDAEKAFWIGYEKLRNGSSVWHDGGMTRAYRHGYWLLINEIDLTPGEILSSCNDIFERAPLSIEETGEVVWPHQNCRIIVTANTAGFGDTTGSFQGRRVQDASFLDRCWAMRFDYMSRDMEIQRLIPVLEVTFPKNIAELIAERLRNIAEKVRDSYTGRNASQAQVAMTMSTRTLLRVAGIIAAMPDLFKRTGVHAYDYALELAMTNKLKDAEPESYQAIHQIALGEFGDEL